MGREVEPLYDVPLREFVRARNALAAQLKKAGRTADAAEVKRLSKPTPPTWIVNQLARQDPETVVRLINAVDRLKRAHLGSRDHLPRRSSTSALSPTTS